MRRARGGRVGRPAACADASGDTWRRGASRASFAVRLWSTPDLDVRPAIRRAAHAHGLEGDRKSAVSGKSVSVRVDLGGRGIIKKKTTVGKHVKSAVSEEISKKKV